MSYFKLYINKRPRRELISGNECRYATREDAVEALRQSALNTEGKGLAKACLSLMDSEAFSALEYGVLVEIKPFEEEANS